MVGWSGLGREAEVWRQHVRVRFQSLCLVSVSELLSLSCDVAAFTEASF